MISSLIHVLAAMLFGFVLVLAVWAVWAIIKNKGR